MNYTISLHPAMTACLAPCLSQSITATTAPAPSPGQHQDMGEIGATSSAGTLFSHLSHKTFTRAAEQQPDLDRHHECGGKGRVTNPMLPVSFPCTRGQAPANNPWAESWTRGSVGSSAQGQIMLRAAGKQYLGKKGLHGEWCKGGGQAPGSQPTHRKGHGRVLS